jgi:hypothetical protein
MHLKALLLTVISSPLLATALRSETDKSGGVYGWCDFTWANSHKVQNVQCGAKDLKCDSHPVYVTASLSILSST